MGTTARQKQLRRDRRDLACSMFGHTCSVCDRIVPPAALDFHHRDPSTKLFSIGLGAHRGEEVFLAELAKCDPICSNCHRDMHSEDTC